MLTNAHQMASGGVPFEGRSPLPKRRRQPSIDLAAIDARAKAENAAAEILKAEKNAEQERQADAVKAERMRQEAAEDEPQKPQANEGQTQPPKPPATGGRRRGNNAQ